MIDKARRNWCAYCRLKRCLQMQMNVNGKLIFVCCQIYCGLLEQPLQLFMLLEKAVQEERGPRKQKPIIQSNIFDDAKTPIFPSSISKAGSSFSVESNQTLNFNVMAQISVACVKQAKLNEHFQQLSAQQQNAILKNVWTVNECFRVILFQIFDLIFRCRNVLFCGLVIGRLILHR